MTGLIAQQGGAADQQVNNYQDAVAAKAQLDALNAQQKRFDAQMAQSQKQFSAEQSDADRTFGLNSATALYNQNRQTKLDAADQSAQDAYEGKGVTVPKSLQPSPKDPPDVKAQKYMSIASFYAQNHAAGPASDYERMARDTGTYATGETRNANTAARDAAMGQFRQQNLAAVTSRFNSKQHQQAQEYAETLGTKVQQFAATYTQRGQIANLNSQDKEYIAQLAGAIRVNTSSDADAVRQAIAQYETQGRLYDAQVRSLDPAVSGAATIPTYTPPGAGGGGPVFNIYGNSAPNAPNASVTTTVPNADGSPVIPPNPNGTTTTQSGLHNIYGNRNATNPNGPGGGKVTTQSNAQNVQADPAVIAAEKQVISGWSASGANAQTLPDILKRAFPSLSDQQRAAVESRVRMQFGLPMPLPAGGMRATGPNPGAAPSSPGGAAPASPFQLPTQ
jgi:hypothetical protein